MLRTQHVGSISLFFCLSLGTYVNVAWAESNTNSTQHFVPPHDVAEIDKIASPPKGSGLLYQIPQWIDSLPTVLPEESDELIVPTTDLTEERTWVGKRPLNTPYEFIL